MEYCWRCGRYHTTCCGHHHCCCTPHIFVAPPPPIYIHPQPIPVLPALPTWVVKTTNTAAAINRLGG